MSNKRSSRASIAVETTASFPNPAQDYYAGPISLDRQLVRRPASTFVLRVTSEALASMGIRAGDEILVDRSLPPRPGRVLVVLIDGEHRLGRLETLGGRAVLITDQEELILRAEDEPWGVATILIHHLPLGPGGTPAVAREAG
ncbi:LexA family protein [Nocardioides sp. YR527]|uniref:LexA family protein n=1 Tax=Nocardioides sp. YR527 TaxID=1881028 RepID=UPI00352458D3